MRNRRSATAVLIAVAGLGLGGCVDLGDPGDSLWDEPTALSSDSLVVDTLVSDTVASDTTVSDTAAFVFPLTLLQPVDGVRLVQNDSTLGCPAHEYRGYGFRWHFVWNSADATANVGAYRLYVRHAGSIYPAVDGVVADTALSIVECNAFVIDANADDWYWFVQGLDSRGTIVAASDSGWFGFEPCRLANGERCSAPALLAPALGFGRVQSSRDAGVERPAH